MDYLVADAICRASLLFVPVSTECSAPLGDTSVGAIVGSECDFAPTSKLMDSLASDNTVGITDIEVGLFRSMWDILKKGGSEECHIDVR